MRTRKRPLRALVPALAASALFLAAGCSADPGSHSPAAQRVPDAGTSATATATADKDQPLAVAAASAAAPASTAVARPGTVGGRARKTSLKVRSYDSRTRRAVISAAGSGGSSPSPSVTPGGTAAPRPAAIGDVIASAPAPGAPDGLLVKVTHVIDETAEGTEVQTAPTTLDTVLGDSQAKGTVPVDPASFDIERMLPDVKVSWAKTGDIHSGPEGTRMPLGSLRVDVAAKVATAEGAPASTAASVSGFVQVAPEVDFSYDGGPRPAPPVPDRGRPHWASPVTGPRSGRSRGASPPPRSRSGCRSPSCTPTP